MNEENSTALSGSTQVKPKKKRSFWFLKLLLILIIFAGGIILGLKLNTMPGPNAILNRYFPSLQSVLNPGAQTAEAAPETPAVTPEPTAAVEEEKPAETPEPAATETVIVGADAPTDILVTAPAEEKKEPEAPIGIDAALTAALNRAKVKEEDALVYGVYPTETNGIAAYQVEFEAGGMEYMYLVDMRSGEIAGWKTARASQSAQDTVPADAPDSTATAGMVKQEELISAEEAEKTALSHAGVRSFSASELTSTLEREGSSAWYEVSFKAGSYQYAYRIDAVSGEVLDYERAK